MFGEHICNEYGSSRAIWELWKRRNKRRYGGNIPLNRLISQVSATPHNLLVYRFPKMKRLSSNWPELVSELESYIPKLYYRRVCWEFPSGQWIQCSTNGASRGNPGKSGAAVVFIDAGGDFLEGNDVIDSLANYAIDEEIFGTFKEFHQLPT
ncbi:hypothetical protein FXO38_18234 [Capsicum annuum]|nr:hypothetical protein FXO38_18234 [Capsicum annuum]KAF3651098.1 hypothetical protein FXO37_18181 [Capsicum annuum]